VTLVIAFGGLILVPILLIPGINVLAAVTVSVLVNGFVIGLLAAGPPLHHRGVGERLAHLRYVWHRRWATIGFGTMSVLVLSIPFSPLRWFTIPAVFVGAVLLHRKFPHQPEPRPHQPELRPHHSETWTHRPETWPHHPELRA
jgi:uncharacterized protein involved in cysteine biosynthesis